MRRIRAEHLLPIACAGAAGLLIASEFMTTFEFDAAGPTTLKVSEAADRHSYAMLVLGVFSLIALAIAVLGRSRPAAVAVAVGGVSALLLFLLLDLPDAGKVGSLNDPQFVNAKADPVRGFWLELIGAVVLAICGGALATLSASQLGALRGAAGPGDGEGEPSPPRRDRASRRPLRGLRSRPINNPDAAPSPNPGDAASGGRGNSGRPEREGRPGRQPARGETRGED